jgi:superfamily II DNA or RNA helicase
MAGRGSASSGAEHWRQSKPLATRCARSFDATARNRGAAHFIEQRVKLTPADETGVGAEVSGIGELPHLVLVDWSDAATEAIVGVFCDCPRLADGYPCEHAWATLLALDAAGAHRHARGSGYLDVIPDYDLDPNAPVWDGDGDEDWDDEPYDDGGGGFAYLDEDLDLELLRALELWLEVNVETTRASGELMLDVYQREERKNGGMGALKRLNLDEGKAALLSDPGDRETAAILLALGGGPNAWLQRFSPYGILHYRPPVRSALVPSGLYDAVLPRLAATGRLGWWEGTHKRPDPEHTLAWDDGPPWRLALRLGPHPARRAARLSGALTREGELVDLAVPVLLLAQGLVLFEDRLARLDTSDAFAWISSLRAQGTLTIPKREVRSALSELGKMPSLPPLVLDDDFPVASESPQARPVLAIEGAAGPLGAEPAGAGAAARVRAQLSFRYGDHRVRSDDPRSVLIEATADPADVKVLRRDGAAETEARNRLVELGAVPAPTGGAYFLPRERFLEAVDRLLEAGWRVEARGARLRRSGGFHLSVATGVDWFDLSGGLDFEGEPVALPRLLEAVRRGQAYVELGDGSHGLLPREWLGEAARFAPGLATLDYTGSGRKALRERFGEHDLVVTTYGTLRRDAAALAGIRFGHAILDEAQAIKNGGSQTAKAARTLAADHRLVLTGTPVENHLSELASLFEFVNPGMLGRASRFQELFGSRRIAAPEDEPVLADLARALGPFILRRTKAQVLPELPAKTEQTLLVTLDRGQRALYDELRSHYRARLTRRIGEVGLARSKMQVLEALLRLRQAACHPGLLDPERAGEGSAKLEALREQLAEVLDEGHKALVFSQFTSLLALVRRDLDEGGVVYEYLDGRTQDRAARVERFQGDPDCRLFLISLKAGGTGLNLTAADYVFLLDPWWNPAVETQAVDRAHRIGQERPVIAYRLIARDTVEEKILELQATKRDLAEAVLAQSGGALRKLSPDDLELLLS